MLREATDDPFDLTRFVVAQNGQDPRHPGIVWEQITSELAAGRKRGHWMWFVFPQVDLGHTATSHHFAIMSAQEAEAYLAHPVLGPRLQTCTEVVLASGAADPQDVFGHVDAKKFRSSMTLFALTAGTHSDSSAPQESVYARALSVFFDGALDPHTVTYLGSFR